MATETYEDAPLEINVNDLTEDLLNPPESAETGLEPEVTEDTTPADEIPADEPAETEEAPEEAGNEPIDEAPAAQPKPKTSPLSATIKLERENRRLRRELAEFRALQTLGQPEETPAKPPEPVLSPLEKWEQENAEALKEDPNLPIPARIMSEDRKWQRDNQAQQTARTTAEQETHKRQVSIAQTKAKYSAEEVGDTLAFDTIVAAGAKLLTREDIADINAVGSRAGEKAYRLCLVRLRESDPDLAQEINSALRARRQSRGAADPANPVRKTTTTNTRKASPPAREAVLGRGKQPVRLHQSLGLRMGP